MITHKIDPEGRYVIIIEYEDGKDVEDMSEFAKRLGEWWHSEEPFIVIAPWSGMKIRIEKIGEEND